jgi:hypothetical protein
LIFLLNQSDINILIYNIFSHSSFPAFFTEVIKYGLDDIKASTMTLGLLTGAKLNMQGCKEPAAIAVALQRPTLQIQFVHLKMAN